MKNPNILIEFSSLAFLLAKRSLFESIDFPVARGLKDNFDTYVESSLSEEEKLEVASLISDTRLDFLYAAGDHTMQSERMEPIIIDAFNHLAAE